MRNIVFTALESKVQPCEVCTAISAGRDNQEVPTYSLTYTDENGKAATKNLCRRCTVSVCDWALEREEKNTCSQ
jgi:hypothetical protein